MSVIPNKQANKAKKESRSGKFLSVKDENNKIIITEDNSFEGQLVKYEYVDEDNSRYANEEGKKHLFHFMTRSEETGELVKKIYNTKSWGPVNKIAQLDKEGVKYFRMWWTQDGKRTSMNVEAIEGEKEEEEVPGTDNVDEVMDEVEQDLADNQPSGDEVDVKNIPF